MGLWRLGKFFTSFHNFKKTGTSLGVQWLGPRAFTVVDLGSVPGQGTKILQAMRCSQKKGKKENILLSFKKLLELRSFCLKDTKQILI